MMITCFLFLVTVIWSTTAELSDITKTCRNVSCEADHDFSHPVHPDKVLKWITAGVPLIFWEAVSKSCFKDDIVSHQCANDLIRISDGIHLNEEWAFLFPDASGKNPAGILKATVTAIGDYDQCMDIDVNGMTGMYCMIDMHHVMKEDSHLSRVNIFGGYPFLSSLCLPSTCTAAEVQRITRSTLIPYNVKVAGDISCETKSDTTWSHRLSNLTTKQLISITLIASFVASVAIGTVYDVSRRLSSRNEEQSALVSLSLVSLWQKLFYAKAWTFDVLVFDCMKLSILVVVTLAHIFTSPESPLAMALLADHSYLNFLMKSANTQFLVTDTGLLGMPLLSAIATFTILYGMAKDKKLRYGAAVVDRIIRFLPPVMVLTACEFIWPVIASGPLVKRMAEFNLQKCEKNWFYNVLFLNNYFIDSIDICAGHSYYSSVDMHLFILGLVGIFVFSRSDNAGILFSTSMIMYGTLKTAYNAIVHQTSFSLFYPNSVLELQAGFFDHIHMPTSSYVAAYFSGFLVAFFRMKGHLTPKLTRRLDHALFVLAIMIAFQSVNVNNMLRNTLNIYPDHLNWLFITINRTLQIMAYILFFVYCMSWKDAWERSQKESAAGPTFSPLKALCRLSFSLYICNYLYVRTELFSRRDLMPSGGFWIMKRILSSLIFVYTFALVFHLFLLAPLDALRESLLKVKRKEEKTS